MAEYGAHLTSATVPDRPSFFEVLAQESLMSTLRPAMKHLIKILAEHNPARYAILHRHADEIYTSLNLLLQHHFLSTTSASFAENFYSLKRVSATASNSSTHQRNIAQGLGLWKHLRSLLFLVLVPYLKLKLEAMYEKWRDEDLDPTRAKNRATPTTQDLSDRLSISAYDMGGVRLKYMSREDILQQAQELDIGPFNSWSAGLWHYLKQAIGVLAISVSQGLSVGIFFLQFLEWWYMSQDTQTRLAVTALPIPKPPKVEKKDEFAVPKDPSLCPLCHKHRTNDTALSTSGYVFCYPCIYSFVKGHLCCPVTNYPTKLSHLVKLYPPDS